MTVGSAVGDYRGGSTRRARLNPTTHKMVLTTTKAIPTTIAAVD